MGVGTDNWKVGSWIEPFLALCGPGSMTNMASGCLPGGTAIIFDELVRIKKYTSCNMDGFCDALLTDMCTKALVPLTNAMINAGSHKRETIVSADMEKRRMKAWKPYVEVWMKWQT